MSELNQRIALVVNSYLKDNEITAQQLAERTGLRPETISRIRRGHHTATLDTLLKLRAVGLDVLTRV